MAEPAYDLIVVGGGIVGLGLARAALLRNPRLRLLVLEKEAHVAAHQTGHNSGVIHSGIYYAPGSLKARLCVQGARAMIDYCRKHDIAWQPLGKVIAATRRSELPALERLEQRGQANGVEARRLNASEVRELEPNIAALAGLHVPSAAIVDYAAVARQYARDIAAAGGELRVNAELTGVQTRGDAVVLITTQGDFEARWAANCAGLQADRISILAGMSPGIRVLPFRGEYYRLGPRAAPLIRGLVYPVPDARFPFLGVHFTPRIEGGVEAGPNAVLSFAREGYSRFSFRARDSWDLIRYRGFWAMSARYWSKGLGEQFRSLSRAAFLRTLRRLLPALTSEDLETGGAGVRAQAVLPNGRMMDDFWVGWHGRFLHVLNVPSPAATASLAVGEWLTDRLQEAMSA